MTVVTASTKRTGRTASARRAGEVAAEPINVKGRSTNPPSRAAKAKLGGVEEASSAVLKLVSTMPAKDVMRALEPLGDMESGLPHELWGPAPSRAEVALASLVNLRHQFEARRDVEASSLSRTQAAELIGISDQAVTDALKARRLLGLKRGKSWCIPSWQLDAETESGMLPGLDKVADVFPGGLISLSAWATRPSKDLGGRSPREALARNDVALVVSVAASLTAAGW